MNAAAATLFCKAFLPLLRDRTLARVHDWITEGNLSDLRNLVESHALMIDQKCGAGEHRWLVNEFLYCTDDMELRSWLLLLTNSELKLREIVAMPLPEWVTG